MTVITIYWILFGLGLGFAAISAFFVGLGEAMSGHDFDFSADHDIDLGGADTADFGGADGVDGIDIDAGADFYMATAR